LSKDENAITALQEKWKEAWPQALSLWSNYTRLSAPTWCRTREEQVKEGLTGSFAMIRLNDFKVVIGLGQILELGLSDFAVPIMAHEAGHHVFAPANLRDNARLAARIERGLPGHESYVGLVSNLYTDLLINDRLKREYDLDMVGVYKTLKNEKESDLWTLYMRIYEMLWGLGVQTLTTNKPSPTIQVDADLGARLIRAYSTEWLDGGGRFACLLLPYIEKEKADMEEMMAAMHPWLDTLGAGNGNEIPDGLSVFDDDDDGGAIHPSEDPNLNGLRRIKDQGDDEDGEGGEKEGNQDRGKVGNTAGESPRSRGRLHDSHRSPSDYVNLLKSLGVTVKPNDLVINYYRERAIPYIVPFPAVETERACDPLPEGLDQWDIGSSVASIDWTESIIRSPHVIPGITTVERTYGTTEGSSPQLAPLDLYIGIDCSGSMPNPSITTSYQVIAGTIMTLSALRAKAKIMACLSGETPGKFLQTDGFLSNERQIMTTLTSYLGTGYAFGIYRLRDVFLSGQTFKRKVHIIVLSDSDLFTMLNVPDGWAIAEESARVAGGGATAVLHLYEAKWCSDNIERLKSIGWNVHVVNDMKDVVAFAKAFSRAKYDMKGQKGRWK
jgi:hypothetical protein